MHEYRIGFPVGIDRHEGEDSVPVTMRRYGFRGTPTAVLIDRRSRIRAHVFGRLDDLQLGAMLGTLVHERTHARPESAAAAPPADVSPPGCADGGCSLEG